MTEVISIKFRACGRQYFFDPGEIKVTTGQKVIVETAKGLEIADCSCGNHMVEDTAVVQPLRSVIRIATEQDIRTALQMADKEKEAFAVCKKKIAEHGLDMKLVSAECSFEGNKTMFFFTSDGRVDFRELVRDLAGIFHNRIELRQIGVRDEARMIGGIAICGRPYCCGEFLDDFAPVSTKMAKVQSLSLNPAKISGSCGRLMCCLRYEEDAYEDLVKRVPKQGAFVQTPDGYGVVEQNNLLRQYVKVRLDENGDGEMHQFAADEVAVIPGGRPQEGEPYPDLLKDLPKKEKEEPLPEEKDLWTSPSMFADSRDVWPTPSRTVLDTDSTEEPEEMYEPTGQYYFEAEEETSHRTRKNGKTGQGKPGKRQSENRQAPAEDGERQKPENKRRTENRQKNEAGRKKSPNQKNDPGQNPEEKQRSTEPGQKKKQGIKKNVKGGTGISAPHKDAENENGEPVKLQHANRPENGGKKKENRFPPRKEKEKDKEKDKEKERKNPGTTEFSARPKVREFGVAPEEPAEKKHKERPATPTGGQSGPESGTEGKQESIPENAQTAAAEGTGTQTKKRYYGNRHRYYSNHGGHGNHGAGKPAQGGN